MNRAGIDPSVLQGFDDAAARAVVLAEREAQALGHDRVGTEHLLLGLLTNDSDASAALSEAGVTLAAARSKVGEAVGMSSTRNTATSGSLPISPRAGRALGRAARFAHADGSDVVTSVHVLRGALDVEGTAGQVLRGLGVDVEALLTALQAHDSTFMAEPRIEPVAADVVVSPRCPSCREPLEEQVVFHAFAARSPDSKKRRDVVLFSCAACGHVIGASPA